MAVTNINIRTDSELKAKAQTILNDLGLDMSTAIVIYLKQIVYKEAIPFAVAKPNYENRDGGKKMSVSELRGLLKGKIRISDDFDAPLEEMKEYME